MILGLLFRLPASASIIASDDFNAYPSDASLGRQGSAVSGMWASNWVGPAPFSVAANVTALWRSGVLVGLKIESVVSGVGPVHYVLSNPNSNETYSDRAIGLTFTGRFAVIADHGGGSTALYLGDGKSLSYRGNSVVIAGNTNSQAEVQFTPGQTPIVSANAPVNVVSAAAPVFTQVSRPTNRVVLFTATGAAGVPYTLWGSTNPAGGAWTTLSTATVTNSPFGIQDAGASNLPSRYYRFSTP